MSYLVIARKWRPRTFEEVVGQAHVTRTLQNAIASGRVAHGYLFTGPRGVGKTSTARILAKALNCAKGPTPHPCLECDSCREIAGSGSVDVQEIDGASNNSVDDIRELREKVLYTGVRDRHKVYIIDEVHMLSTAAFNALLKTLEEPPPHVLFIFATTEVHKVPETILSRTQRFDFRRIGARDLMEQLGRILQSEGVASTPEALALVARSAGGSMRDAQTLLDQVISYAGGEAKAVTSEDVLQVLGGVQESEALGALLPALRGECRPAFEFCARAHERGADFDLVLETIEELLRAAVLLKTAPEQAPALCGLLPETLAALEQSCRDLSLSRLLSLLEAAAQAQMQLRHGPNPRLWMEIFFIKAGAARPQASIGELFDELVALERRWREGGSAPQEAASAPPPAREEPAAPPAVAEIEEAAPLAELNLEALKAGWEGVVERASRVSLLLGTCVRDAELFALDKGELVLRTRNERQKEILAQPAHRQRLEAALKEVFGADLKLKVLYAPPAKPAERPAPKAGKPTPEELERLRQEIPAVRRFEELFDAEITEIRRH